ncbi:MAG: uroporphyrinogen-III C-methyltransferase [Pseudomonadota bacterium]
MSEQQSDQDDAATDVIDTPAEPVSDAAGDVAETPRKKSKLGLIATGVILIAVAAGAIWLKQGGDAPATTPTANEAAAQQSDAAPATTPAASSTAPATVAQSTPQSIIPAATQADIDDLRDALRRVQAELEASRSEVATLSEAVRNQERENARLTSSIDERVDLLDSLPGRVLNLEQGVETLQGISAGSRDAWLLAEAEYYMQIANAQVQLANNPALAARALQLADARVRELANPSYTPVRRAIAEEVATLTATEDVDIEGITLSLGSLAAMVPTLPLINEISVPEADGEGDVDIDTLSGWQRARTATSQAMSGMFRVRKSDERVEAMLSPEAEYFLRLNLQLQLQAARLSLLLGDAAGFRQSLEDAGSWLSEYFDTDNPSVANALTLLEQTASSTVVTARPDVSGSLTLLRRQRTLERAGE